MNRLVCAGLALLGVSLAPPDAQAAQHKVGITATPAAAGVGTTAAAASLPAPIVVHYESNGLSLKAWIYKPEGPGPFPAILSNHGSEKDPIVDKATAQFWL